MVSEGFVINTFNFCKPASQGFSGILSIGDLDGDWLRDLAVPGDRTQGLFFLHQKPDHIFERSTIATGEMYGMAHIVDIDGDSKQEIL